MLTLKFVKNEIQKSQFFHKLYDLIIYVEIIIKTKYFEIIVNCNAVSMNCIIFIEKYIFNVHNIIFLIVT